MLERAGKHAFVDMWMGGIRAAVYGGESSPIRDMIGGAVSSIGNGYIDENMNDMVLKVASSAVLGGTISEIGGGKFANGAVTGAYSMLFNEFYHDGKDHYSGIRKVYNSIKKFFSDHFYIGAEGEFSYGVQIAGYIKKGAGINIDPVSEVIAEGSVSNRGYGIDNYSLENFSNAERVKAVDFGGGKTIGGNYNWNVVNGSVVSKTASLGVCGFGGNLTWNDNGPLNLFVGFELGGKVAVGYGLSGSLKIGFTWNF